MLMIIFEISFKNDTKVQQFTLASVSTRTGNIPSTRDVFKTNT